MTHVCGTRGRWLNHIIDLLILRQSCDYPVTCAATQNHTISHEYTPLESRLTQKNIEKLIKILIMLTNSTLFHGWLIISDLWCEMITCAYFLYTILWSGVYVYTWGNMHHIKFGNLSAGTPDMDGAGLRVGTVGTEGSSTIKSMAWIKKSTNRFV